MTTKNREFYRNSLKAVIALRAKAKGIPQTQALLQIRDELRARAEKDDKPKEILTSMEYEIDSNKDLDQQIGVILEGEMQDQGLFMRQKNQVTDIDGNVYNTVTIGTQVWMVENLKTTRINDGTAIPLVTEATTWSDLSTPCYCWYNNNEAIYKATYGALYNWYAVNTGKLCPSGWHVPTDAEWTVLTDYLGGEDVAGGKMKERGTTHWLSPNTGATNESGFFALPGNCHRSKEVLKDFRHYSFWWSSTEYISGKWNYAWSRILRYNFGNILRYRMIWMNGFSVRCVKDL